MMNDLEILSVIPDGLDLNTPINPKQGPTQIGFILFVIAVLCLGAYLVSTFKRDAIEEET